MSTLKQLAEVAGGRLVRADNPEMEISSIGLNAQELQPGGLFAGVPGTHVHGAKFADESEASAVITDDAGLELITSDSLPVIVVPDVRAVLGAVSSVVYNHPSHKLTIIGITGTSGKTTTSYMVEAALLSCGISTGLIGTTGTRINGSSIPTSLTTPEAPNLQALFARMVSEGVTHVVMEVSSHAIALGRVSGTRFAVAGFTNLSQDHLDFHPTMQDYFETKARLFDENSGLAAKSSVVCVDDEWGQSLARRVPDALTVAATKEGIDWGAQLFPGDIHVTDSGLQETEIHTAASSALDGTHLRIPIPGRFNVANALVAIGLLSSIDVDMREAMGGLATVSVPGRLERIDDGQDFLAVVDYAHKPGAIAAVLETLKEQVRGRIGIVVGAGGDRDHSKRPKMGREAAKRSDLVIITDDNPRSEEPSTIRRAVMDGALKESADQDEKARVEIREIGDRAQAIVAAVEWARSGDAIVIAGKGHETGQLVKGVNHEFDDRVHLREALEQRLSGDNHE